MDSPDAVNVFHAPNVTSAVALVIGATTCVCGPEAPPFLELSIALILDLAAAKSLAIYMCMLSTVPAAPVKTPPYLALPLVKFA